MTPVTSPKGERDARMLSNRPEASILADLRSRGVEFETDGIRLRWRPAFLVTAAQAEAIRSHRAAIIELLSGPDWLERCPLCRWPLDAARRCPKCFDRLCLDCRRPTGSYFILRCLPCGNAEKETTDVEENANV